MPASSECDIYVGTGKATDTIWLLYEANIREKDYVKHWSAKLKYVHIGVYFSKASARDLDT